MSSPVLESRRIDQQLHPERLPKAQYLSTPSSSSLPMPVPNHKSNNHNHNLRNNELQTDSTDNNNNNNNPGQMVLTPPNSVSPAFHSQIPGFRPVDSAHRNGDVDSDLDLQETPDAERVRAHTQPPFDRSQLPAHQSNGPADSARPSSHSTSVGAPDDESKHAPLCVSALTALKNNEAITPQFLATHYLQPLVRSDSQFLAFDHLLAYLTTTVPGFSRISPAKARRLVTAALRESESSLCYENENPSANVTRVEAGGGGTGKTSSSSSLFASAGADNTGAPWAAAANDTPRNSITATTATPKLTFGTAAPATTAAGGGGPAGMENVSGKLDHFSPPNSFPSPPIQAQQFTPVTPDHLHSGLSRTYQDRNPLCHHQRLSSSATGGSPVFSFSGCDGCTDNDGRPAVPQWKSCDRCDIDDGVDVMSLDGEDGDGDDDRSGRPFCCSPTPEDDCDLNEDGDDPVDDEANDMTDEEDWESIGADALLARSCPGQSYMQGGMQEQASHLHIAAVGGRGSNANQYQNGYPISPHSMGRPPSSFAKSVPTPSHMGAMYSSMDRARQHQSQQQQQQQLLSNEEERVAAEALISMGQRLK